MSAADRISAMGFATFFPAMSGALPCTASNTAAAAPTFAPGTMPSPPTSPDARSDTMSPYRFSKRMTSNGVGSSASSMQRLSITTSSYSISEFRSATRRQQSRNNPSVSFMIDALCAAVTFRRPSRRASMNAYSAIRVHAVSVKIFSVSTTPFTTSCSRPE